VSAVAELITLRPPSYQTIDDPPPYPDDDDDDCPLTADKRPAARQRSESSNRVGVERRLASSSELLQLHQHQHYEEDARQLAGDDAFHQPRDAVARRRRADLLTCRRSLVSSNLVKREIAFRCYSPRGSSNLQLHFF